MKETLDIVSLYDCYRTLLTEKQQNYFEEYYFENLTLSELSENYHISRNAVHKSLKETELKLQNYENKLHLNEKNHQLEMIIDQMKDLNLKEKLKKML